MSEKTNIEWTGRKLGAMKTAAKRVGIPFDDYKKKILSGLHWCHGCRDFHEASVFVSDVSRSGGLSKICSVSKNKRTRSKYVAKPKVSKLGHRFTAARDGDKQQARARVNQRVKTGLIPSPNSLPCTDCGHTGDDKRHEYDHHLGYAVEHQEDVEPVCTTCHSKRGRDRGEINQLKDEQGRFTTTANDGVTHDGYPEVKL